MKFYFQNLSYLIPTFILSPLFYFLTFLNKRKAGGGILENGGANLKILVIQTTKIGDIICTTPVFREIKKKYPKSHLAVLIISRVKEILELNHYIDEFIILDAVRRKNFFGGLALAKEIKRKNFNWSVNFTPTLFNSILPFWAGIPNRAQIYSKLVSRAAYICSFFSNYRYPYKQNELVLRQYLDILKFLEIKNCSENKDVFFTEDSISKAKNFLYKEGVKKDDFIIGVSLSAGNKIKEWESENFGKLSDILTENLGAKIVFLGSASDKNLIDKTKSVMKHRIIDSSSAFSLKELPSLIKLFKIFISVDTGPLYIANALDIPVVDIIGPFNVCEQLSLNEKCEIVSKKIYCFPCSHIIPTAHICKEGHRKCVGDITPEDVYKAIVRLKKRIYS